MTVQHHSPKPHSLQAPLAHPVSLYVVTAVIVMDTEGNRLLAKYYPEADESGKLATNPKAQAALEALLYSRIMGPNGASASSDCYSQAEVCMLDGLIAVYRANLDVVVYVLGGANQNEMFLCTALDTYFEVLTESVKPQLEKKNFFDAFEMAVLGLDEAIDRGVILETDPKEIIGKLQRSPPSASQAFQSFVEKPLKEQTLASAFKMAREQMRSFF